MKFSRNHFNPIYHLLADFRTDLTYAVRELSKDGSTTSKKAQQHFQRKLALVESALMRVQRGRYGKCDVCEKRIDSERLKLLPYAESCLQCRKGLDTDGGQ